jgi:hypothetical protein
MHRDDGRGRAGRHGRRRGHRPLHLEQVEPVLATMAMSEAAAAAHGDEAVGAVRAERRLARAHAHVRRVRLHLVEDAHRDVRSAATTRRGGHERVFSSLLFAIRVRSLRRRAAKDRSE